MLLSRYGSLKEVGEMPYRKGYALVKKAYTERDKDKWFKIWLSVKPHDGDKLIPFETWYKDLADRSKSAQAAIRKSKDDILAEAAEIRRKVGVTRGDI